MVARPNYTLDFSAPGYDAVERSGVDAAADADSPGPDVVLEARRGAVRATVRLGRLQTPTRLQAVDVGLFTEPPGDEALRSVNPDAAGDVLIDNLVPGRYRLRASAPGYLAESRLVVLDPDSEVFAGTLDLQHVSTTASAVALSGTVRLEISPTLGPHPLPSE